MLQSNIELYKEWAPVVARVIFGLLFIMAAYFKIPGSEMFEGGITMTAAAGIPFANIAVFLAFVLELIGGVALIIGWKTRFFAFLLAGFVLILNLVFFRDLANQASFGTFISNMGWVAGLMYISIFGPGHLSLDNRIHGVRTMTV